MAQPSMNDITEAINRVNEMRRRADSFVAGESKDTAQNKNKSEKKNESNNSNKESTAKNNESSGIAGQSDELLVLLTVILLSRENADRTLILALLYILL